MPANKQNVRCTLISRTQEAEDVVTLRFKVDGDVPFSFVAGQYVILYPEGRSEPGGKAYTISSTPDDELIAITVKKIGKFSTALHELSVGAAVMMEGPMGSFFPEDQTREIVFLAAGIGITPFMSVIRAYEKGNILAQKKIFLFYSSKTKEDIVFFDELNAVSEKNGALSVFHYVTRQRSNDKHIQEFRRIDIGSIRKKLRHLEGKDYFICGPIKFVADIRRALLDGGVDALNVHTEAFY